MYVLRNAIRAGELSQKYLSCPATRIYSTKMESGTQAPIGIILFSNPVSNTNSGNPATINAINIIIIYWGLFARRRILSEILSPWLQSYCPQLRFLTLSDPATDPYLLHLNSWEYSQSLFKCPRIFGLNGSTLKAEN
jgi:hypothetical protein